MFRPSQLMRLIKRPFLYPYFFGGVSISDDINPNWKFELEGDTDIGSGLGLGIRPPAKLNVVAGWSGLLDTTNLKLKLIVTRKQNGDKIYLLATLTLRTCRLQVL